MIIYSSQLMVCLPPLPSCFSKMYPLIRTTSVGGLIFRKAALSCAKLLLLQSLMIFMLLPFSQPAWSAKSIHVIGHSTDTVKQVDRSLLSNIFKRRIRVNKEGTALVAVNLPVDHPLRKVFSEILFGQDPQAMERYWNEQYFKGISPPFVLSSMEAVKRFVVSTPGAIAYVLDCQGDERTEILFDIPLSVQQSRQLDGFCMDEMSQP